MKKGLKTSELPFIIFYYFNKFMCEEKQHKDKWKKIYSQVAPHELSNIPITINHLLYTKLYLEKI